MPAVGGTVSSARQPGKDRQTGHRRRRFGISRNATSWVVHRRLTHRRPREACCCRGLGLESRGAARASRAAQTCRLLLSNTLGRITADNEEMYDALRFYAGKPTAIERAESSSARQRPRATRRSTRRAATLPTSTSDAHQALGPTSAATLPTERTTTLPTPDGAPQLMGRSRSKARRIGLWRMKDRVLSSGRSPARHTCTLRFAQDAGHHTWSLVRLPTAGLRPPAAVSAAP